MLVLLNTSARADAFASVTSSEGWNISVRIAYTGIDILYPSNDCKYGFNYTRSFSYEVIYSDGGASRTWELGITGGCIMNEAEGSVNLPVWKGLSGNFSDYGKYSYTNTKCNKIDPADFACETMKLVISAPGISKRSLPMTYIDNNAILPVSLIDFTAAADSDRVEMTWKTGSEINSAYFTVERSANGSDWEPLLDLKAAGSDFMMNDYRFTDTHPLPGINYYRLIQVDIDGTLAISPVTTANVEMKNLRLFPNPVADVLLLQNFTELRIFDLQGTELTANLPTTHQANGDFTVDVSQLQRGLYIARSGTSFRRFQRL